MSGLSVCRMYIRLYLVVFAVVTLAHVCQGSASGTYMHICACISSCIYTRNDIYVSICKSICMYTNRCSVYVHVYVYTYVYIICISESVANEDAFDSLSELEYLSSHTGVYIVWSYVCIVNGYVYSVCVCYA
jgi:H+/gluconate symporter-like permease